jgi:hypothetical protein
MPWYGPLLAAAALVPVLSTSVHAQLAVPQRPALAVVDLASAEGAREVQARWRYTEARLVPTSYPGPGPDGQPTGAPIHTWTISPRASEWDRRRVQWQEVPPAELSKRRGPARIAFAWYRLEFVVPHTIQGRSTSGGTLVFDAAVDDYAEIWIDGELTRALGQRGQSVVAGWNATNRLIVARGIQPGRRVEIAIFGINGPISAPPTNFVWVRHARLELHAGGGGVVVWSPAEVNVEVDRIDPRIDRIAGPNPKLWKLADGLSLSESGPVLEADHAVVRVVEPLRVMEFSFNGEALGAPAETTRPLRGSDAVDVEGNRYHPVRQGVRIVAPDGALVGTLVTPRRVHAVAFGGADSRSLFIAAGDSLYRFRAGIPGRVLVGGAP